MINVFQPELSKEELQAIAKVFSSNWIGKGEQVKQFEEKFAAMFQISPDHFTSTTCCTEALFLASELFNYDSTSEIIVPDISFVAAGSSVLAKHAKLVLCDVDPRTLNATADSIKEKISSKTKAVILNHYGGVPCEMEPIAELCRTKNILIIEDSACAIRSFYKGRGCGTIGDMGVWSFDAMKAICTGDGGMIYLKSPEKMINAREFLYLGLPVKEKSGMDGVKAGKANWWEYDIRRYGRRALMNNIMASIGLEQLNKLNRFLHRKKEICETYMQELSSLDWLVLPPPLPDYIESSYYFFWVQLANRDGLAKFLYENGVYTTFRYWPLHKVKLFNSKSRFPNSDYVSKHTLNLPLHQSLSDNDVAKIIELIFQYGRQQ